MKQKAINQKKPPVVVIDFETYYDKECSVKDLGAAAYVAHPKFDAYLVSIVSKDLGIEWVGHPKKAPWKKLTGAQPVAHNAQFDWTVYNWCVKHKYAPDCKFLPWRDTAGMAAWAGLPRNLAGAVKQQFNVDLDKGMRTWMMGRTWADAVAAGKEEQLKQYALDDSIYALRLYEEFATQIMIEEFDIMEFTVDSGMMGLAIDVPYVKKQLIEIGKYRRSLEAQIPWIEDGGAPTSIKQIAQACRDLNIPPPKTTAEDSPIFEDWLAEYSERAPFVKAVQRFRKINRVEKLFITLLRRQVDGIFGFSKKYYGAHTGRFSGDGGFNMENLPREPFETFDLKRAFVPRPKHKFFVADYAQIEARILLWFAGDTKQLDIIRTGVSVYEAHAKATMGYKGDNLKKENNLMYRLAKARVLGLGYGCGDKKFVQAAKSMAGVDLSMAESSKTVNAYRAANKGIVSLWARLDAEARAASNTRANAAGYYSIELPSGREVRYFNLQRRGGQTFAQHVKGEPHKMIYGGLLTENLVQATARDVLCAAVLRLRAAGYVPLLTVHDEIVVEMKATDDPEKIAAIIRECPDWLEGCPFDIDYGVANHYQKPD